MSRFACRVCSQVFEIEDGMAADIAKALTSDKAGPICPTCFEQWVETRPEVEEPVVPVRTSPYLFTDDMDEISGFGGGYEQTCRNMVAAGMEWFDANPDADPKFKGNESIYGLILEDNEDAKALSAAVVAAANGDCTGAMHQATVSHCLYARKNGWEKYCEAMRKDRD